MNNIILNALGNTVYNGLQWLITVIAARKSGLDTSGVLTLAMSFSLTLRAISYFGVRNYLVSDTNNKYSYSDYTGMRIITCIISYVICIFLMFTGNYTKAEILCILFYMIFRISEGFSDLYESILQKSDRLDTAGIMMLLKGIITTVFFLIGFLITSSLAAGIFMMSISAVLFTFTLEYHVTAKILKSSLKPSFNNIRPLFSEIIKVFICTLEISIIYNLPEIMLSDYPDDKILGAYGSIFSICLILHAIFQYIYVPFIVKLSEIKENRHEFNKLMSKILLSFCIVLLIFLIIGKLFGMKVISMIYGNETLEYKFMLIPTIFAVGAYSLMTFAGNIVLIERNFFSLILSHTIGAVICFVSGKLLLETTPLGASYSLMVSSLSAILAMIIVSRIKPHK